MYANEDIKYKPYVLVSILAVQTFCFFSFYFIIFISLFLIGSNTGGGGGVQTPAPTPVPTDSGEPNYGQVRKDVLFSNRPNLSIVKYDAYQVLK